MTELYCLPEEGRQESISAIKRVLEKEPSLAFAYLYGSVMEREMIHDIDVGIYLNHHSYEHKRKDFSTLADQLSLTLSMPIDIRVLNNAPLPFLYHVLRGELLLCRDEELLTRLLEDIPRQYLDLAPILRHSIKDAFAA